MYRKHIYLTVNGEIIELGGKEAIAPLSDTLRYYLGKTGTKVVCAEGDCGACTVMLARAREGVYRSINACIYPTFLADGCHLVTVEGLAKNSELHEVQQSMMRNFGGQCGFCTPGFVMSLVNLYEHKTAPKEQNVKNYLTGNLCRCTGYQPIVQAALDINAKKMKSLGEMYPLKKETETLISKTAQPILIEIEEREFFAPVTLQQAVEYKNRRPHARIFSGATDLGVQINKGKFIGEQRMSLHLLEELNEIKVNNSVVGVGARVTLEKLQTVMAAHVPQFADFLNIFASPQIKNSATLVGNLANGSPIADTTPFLLAMDAHVSLLGPSGQRVLPITQFFKGYKSLDMAENEFITHISWPLVLDKKTKIGLYKVSQRRDLDISCVNACFVFRINSGVIEDARIALGGVAAVPLRLGAIEKSLLGHVVSKDLIAKTNTQITDAIQPLSDARGSADFRKSVTQELFQKFAMEHLQP